MSNQIDLDKLRSALNDLKTAISDTMNVFDRVRSGLDETLSLIEVASTPAAAPEPAAPTITPESVAPVAAPVAPPAPEPQPVAPVAAPVAPPAPQPETPQPVMEPTTTSSVSTPPAPPAPAPEPQPVAPVAAPVAPPTPPPPPPPPEVSTLNTPVAQLSPGPASYVPGPTVTATSSDFTVSDALDKVFQQAQSGSTGDQLNDSLIAARDKIQQVVSVSPAIHEISSYSRQLRMLKANPLTPQQILELKEHIDDWKKRLGK